MSGQQAADTVGDLTALLDTWVAEELITSQQAERIRAREHARAEALAAPVRPTLVAAPRRPAAPAERTSLVAEALGYLGGVLVVVAVALITARYWNELPLGIRLGLAAAASVLLLAAGITVPERLGASGGRLRAVLWLLSTGACAGFLGLVGVEVFKWENGEDVAVLVGGCTAVCAGVLWARNRSILQQVAFLGALLTTAGAAAAHLDGGQGSAPGLAVWGLGLVWLALAWGRLLAPRRAAYILGSVAALFGAQMTMVEGWGHIVALATVAALVGAGVVVGDLVVLGIGTVATLMTLPGTMQYYFPGALAAPVALLAAGVLLVAAALRTTRRREQPRRARPGRDYTTGTRPVALAVAAAIALVVTVAVVSVGLA